ncbi:MAG: glycosyltransferase [Planctomycetota bacterium]
MWLVLGVLAFVMAAFTAIMFAVNLRLFCLPVPSETDQHPPVSVLIPARDEADGIGAAIDAALSAGNDVEVVVLDDGSTDDTGTVVRRAAAQHGDDRVRLIEGITLPDGWNGKQHACFRLAGEARHDAMLFLDADVRLRPGAIATLCKWKSRTLAGEPLALLSAFPRQETGTLFEKMLIPMMHQILLCFLPFVRMRSSTHPAYASGCGQLFLTDRSSYKRAGGHAAIRDTRHDGLKLPKAYRSADLMTDCVDGTSLATCRMYRNAGEVVRGLLKNAHEGIANAKLLPPFAFMLLAAFVLPWIVLFGSANARATDRNLAALAFAVAVVAILASYASRTMAMIRFQQSPLGTLLHPIGILVFLGLQIIAFVNHLLGRQVAWRGRS